MAAIDVNILYLRSYHRDAVFPIIKFILSGSLWIGRCRIFNIASRMGYHAQYTPVIDSNSIV